MPVHQVRSHSTCDVCVVAHHQQDSASSIKPCSEVSLDSMSGDHIPMESGRLSATDFSTSLLSCPWWGKTLHRSPLTLLHLFTNEGFHDGSGEIGCRGRGAHAPSFWPGRHRQGHQVSRGGGAGFHQACWRNCAVVRHKTSGHIRYLDGESKQVNILTLTKRTVLSFTSVRINTYCERRGRGKGRWSSQGRV